MLRDYLGVDEQTEPATARARIEATLLSLDRDLAAELSLIFDFLGVSDPARPPERIDPEARQRRLLAFVGCLVRARSRRRAAITVLEDLHWIDPASALFVDALADAVPGTRTLVLALFRPEYEAEWMRRAPHELLPLDALDHPHAAELLGELLSADPALDPLREAIGARAAGNPFFTEEIVRALAEEGRLVGERGAYRLAAPASELVLPATVEAVLGARIDRLPAREKALLQQMAVIGNEAPKAVLGEVAELGGRELDASLDALEAAELLAESRANGPRELSFRHPLTQEVAYASQLSGARAGAHAAVAAAIERLYPHRLDERAALVAHHREAAGEPLAAARWHARAAVWASAASPAEGMRHWRRVRELADSLSDSEEVTGLAVGARIGILSLSWRVGMADEEAEAVHAEGLARLEPGSSHQRVLLDLAYGGHVINTGREVEGAELEPPSPWPGAPEKQSLEKRRPNPAQWGQSPDRSRSGSGPLAGRWRAVPVAATKGTASAISNSVPPMGAERTWLRSDLIARHPACRLAGDRLSHRSLSAPIGLPTGAAVGGHRREDRSGAAP